jgi:hypothetical protein
MLAVVPLYEEAARRSASRRQWRLALAGAGVGRGGDDRGRPRGGGGGRRQLGRGGRRRGGAGGPASVLTEEAALAGRERESMREGEMRVGLFDPCRHVGGRESAGAISGRVGQG